jgi:hypothetical protein
MIRFVWFLSVSASINRHKRDFAAHFPRKVTRERSIDGPLRPFAGQKPRQGGQIRSKVTLDVSMGGQFREKKSAIVSRDGSFRRKSDHYRAIGGHFGSKVTVFRSNVHALPSIVVLFRDVADAHLAFAALPLFVGERRTGSTPAVSGAQRAYFEPRQTSLGLRLRGAPLRYWHGQQ